MRAFVDRGIAAGRDLVAVGNLQFGDCWACSVAKPAQSGLYSRGSTAPEWRLFPFTKTVFLARAKSIRQ